MIMTHRNTRMVRQRDRVIERDNCTEQTEQMTGEEEESAAYRMQGTDDQQELYVRMLYVRRDCY